jgi:hypothetical protein
VKTSLTLSPDVLSAIDRLAGSKHSGSLHRGHPPSVFTGSLNTAAEDVLRYQHFEDQREPAMKPEGFYRVYRSERAQSTACAIRGIAFVVEVN